MANVKLPNDFSNKVKNTYCVMAGQFTYSYRSLNNSVISNDLHTLIVTEKTFSLALTCLKY